MLLAILFGVNAGRSAVPLIHAAASDPVTSVTDIRDPCRQINHWSP